MTRCVHWLFVVIACGIAIGWGSQFSQAFPPANAGDAISFAATVVPDDPFDAFYKKGNEAPQPQVSIRRGQVVKIQITGKVKPGYHTYPLTSRTARQEPAQVWDISFGSAQGIVPLWPILETAPEPEMDKSLRPPALIFVHHHEFHWLVDVLIAADAKPGVRVLPISLRGTVCDEGGCLLARMEVKAEFTLSSETPLEVSPAVEKRRTEPKPEPTVVEIKGQETAPPAASHGGILDPITSSGPEYKKNVDELRIVNRQSVSNSADLLGFILAGIFWGAVSLITPCVFPMIPITVSFFLKQSEKEHHRPVFMALIYSGTIVVVLTLAAAFLLTLFRWLSVNPIMNYAMGILFIYFALSLFGMYDIELPSGLARFTSAREGKGGVVGVIFMALTFTIISFACVAPFLGGFGGTSAGQARPLWHNLLGGLAFSATFAAPFFFLALFPTLLRKMPKSGTWLNTVKVVMGFLEFAAAFVFFRTAELVATSGAPWLFTFDLVLGIYIALSFMCAMYLFGVFRLPHDTPEEHLGVLRMVFAGLFLALGLYLLPALFKTGERGEPQRPGGTIYAWVEAFLLPESRPGKDLPHTGNLPAAIAKSREVYQKTGKAQRIFVDLTGVTCKNCNLNENNVFSKAEIQKLMEPYLIVKLYTDVVPPHYYGPGAAVSTARQKEDADVNLSFQKRHFNTEQLPLYAVLQPQLDNTIEVVGVYDEGRINNELGFKEFLRDPK